jgi:hypothetical protein
MRNILVVVAFVLPALWSSAGLAYDDGWYKWEGWSGEYPPGFSVTGRKTVLMGRTDMDPDLPRNVACQMPYRAVIHPWNRERVKQSKIKFYSFTRIIKLTAKDDYFLIASTNGTEEHVPIPKGTVLEYIHYVAEGEFEVRLDGKHYTAGQDLFEHLEEVPNDRFVEHDWVVLTCANSARASILLDDVRSKTDADVLVPGISAAGPGLPQYETARDLTDAEAVGLERKRGK